MKHTPVLKENLPITESSRQSNASVDAEIRDNPLKPYIMTGSHLGIVI